MFITCCFLERNTFMHQITIFYLSEFKVIAQKIYLKNHPQLRQEDTNINLTKQFSMTENMDLAYLKTNLMFHKICKMAFTKLCVNNIIKVLA